MCIHIHARAHMWEESRACLCPQHTPSNPVWLYEGEGETCRESETHRGKRKNTRRHTREEAGRKRGTRRDKLSLYALALTSCTFSACTRYASLSFARSAVTLLMVLSGVEAALKRAMCLVVLSRSVYLTFVCVKR